MKTLSEIKRSRTRRAILGALCGAVLLASLVASEATAMPPGPSGGPTTLSFVNEQARLVGSQALVLVRCEGPQDSICSGTLRLSFAGTTRTTPVSVVAGSQQNLDVSLGHTPPAHSKSALAVLSAVQSSGAPAQSRAVLHFR